VIIVANIISKFGVGTLQEICKWIALKRKWWVDCSTQHYCCCDT